jgi:hypothetical protein
MNYPMKIGKQKNKIAIGKGTLTPLPMAIYKKGHFCFRADSLPSF